MTAGDDSYNLVLGADSQQQQAGVVLLSSGVFRIDAPGVLRNDTFEAGSTLTVRATINAKNGRFQLRNDGTLFYLPSTGKIGIDSFTYAISDGKTRSTATVRLIVIDRRAPELRFDTPADRTTVKTIDKIAGRVRDRNAGLKSLTLLWKRFDGAFWNGREWTSSPLELPLVVTGINWIYSGNLPTAGTNATTDLLDGRYDLRVTATDNSGNITRLTNRITVNSDSEVSVTSPVRLSSAGASAERDVIVLNFTGALDSVVAVDGDHYALKVNGVAVGVGNADYSDNVVTLSNLELNAGDEIELKISGLLDADGKALKGGTINLVER